MTGLVLSVVPLGGMLVAPSHFSDSDSLRHIGPHCDIDASGCDYVYLIVNEFSGNFLKDVAFT
jgi:hypothetical protein